MIKGLEIRVYGTVHGVNFRYYTEQIANGLNLTGHVKNLDNGAVEIYAEGESKPLEKLLAWARRGPSFAKVEKVDYFWKNAKNQHNDFKIIY